MELHLQEFYDTLIVQLIGPWEKNLEVRKKNPENSHAWLWLSRVWANERRHYICNVFSYWLKPYSTIDRKPALYHQPICTLQFIDPSSPFSLGWFLLWPIHGPTRAISGLYGPLTCLQLITPLLMSSKLFPSLLFDTCKMVKSKSRNTCTHKFGLLISKQEFIRMDWIYIKNT